MDLRPDLVVYRTDLKAAQDAYKCELQKKSAVSKSRQPYMAKCAWSWMKLFVEVKRTEATSGFKFTSGGFLNTSDEGNLSRAQVAKYASEIMLRQHRTHLFSLFICGMSARILRWDRAGCIVTDAINLKTDWKKLYNFIYRFAMFSPDQEGYDTTAKLADEADIAKLRAYTSPNRVLMSCRDHMLRDLNEDPIYKVGVCGSLIKCILTCSCRYIVTCSM